VHIEKQVHLFYQHPPIEHAGLQVFQIHRLLPPLLKKHWHFRSVLILVSDGLIVRVQPLPETSTEYADPACLSTACKVILLSILPAKLTNGFSRPLLMALQQNNEQSSISLIF